MKHFLFLAAFALLSFTGLHAETYNAKIADTTITGTATPSYSLNMNGEKSNVSFQYVITKTSGTVAGTIALQGSIDGADWATINTYTLTDASATTALTYDYNGYSKYRVVITTSGTLVANFKIWTLYRGS